PLHEPPARRDAQRRVVRLRAARRARVRPGAQRGLLRPHAAPARRLDHRRLDQLRHDAVQDARARDVAQPATDHRLGDAPGFGGVPHHLFAAGSPPLALAFFGGASILITIPSAVAVFSWLATLWDGRPWYPAAMKFMLGFVALFVIGGVSGVMTAAVPFDWQ